jgi:outer membrane protein OmpA-like peptidoglycan-associated protein
MNYRSIIYLLILVLILSMKLHSEVPSGYDEAVFSIRYNSFSVEKIVYFSFDKQILYIPFTDYLSFLLIYYKTDDGEKYTGYVNNPDSSFVIDFKEKYFTSYYTKSTKISDDWWFNKDGQLYCQLKMLDSVFHIETRLNVSDLSAYFKSEITFPVVRNYQALKQLHEGGTITSDEEVPDYPKIETNTFKWINGGILDYNLSVNKSGENYSSSAFLNTGLELLGGAFQVATTGNYNNINRNIQTYTKFAWKYNFEENSYISTVNLGEQYTTIDLNQPTSWIRGSSAILYGFEINNRPLLMPRQYEKRLITRQLGKYWKSEVKIDDRQTLMLQTDDEGKLSFLLPIRYGVTQYNAKCYGPNGEFDQFSDEIYVPTQMLKMFQVQYDITGGIDETDNTKVINGNFQLGLTSWETFNVSIFQRENQRAEMFFGNLTELWGNMIMGMSYSPENMFGSSLNFSTRGGENFNIGYTKFLKRSTFNTSDASDRVDLQGSFNRFFNLPFSLNLMGSYLQSSSYKNLSLTPTLYTYYKNISIMSKYLLYYSLSNYGGLSRRDGLELDLSYYTGLGELLGFDNRIRMDLRTNYDIPNKQLGSITLMINDDLGKGLQLSGNITREMTSGRMSGGISVTLYNDILQYRGNSSFSDNQAASFGSSLNGSINIDLSTPTVYLSNSMGGGGRGKGGANIRFYQDLNNNGIYDSDEPIMKGVKLNTPGKFTRVTQSNGIVMINDLVPGDKYSVKVAKESFSNPYIRPKVSEFSFYPEPNVITKIDIPCFSTGILEGRIIKKDKKEITGQGGVKLHLVNLDSTQPEISIEVFSDGTFYTMGVPVGQYKLSVDSVQLKLLKSKTIPKERTIEIHPTADGDYIGQIEFEVTPLTGEPTSPDKLSIESEESLAATKASSHSDHSAPLINQNKQAATDGTSLAVSPEEKEILSKIDLQNQELNNIQRPATTKYTVYYNKAKDTYLNYKAKNELAKLAKAILSHPTTKILLEAHSDDAGTLKENYEISEKRASEIVTYLMKQGIAANQLIIHPKGSIQPIVDNTSEESRKKNRCVVVKVIE